ncbi:helix-turn-helix transcriptional regulator [Christensenellaceae bacterium 44-20]
MGIGERIAKLRKWANLTQKQLAEMVGVSSGMIAQIERGTKTVSLQLGKLIARALGVGILEIIGRD